jgi:S-adenosyl-L-methionine hydrolase (adenosine-forming)
MGAIITFLSDFGTSDGYVAQVKAVILAGIPDATVVDITHEVQPYKMLSAAWILSTTYKYFPQGTFHLAVVDPGVGTSRDVLIVREGGHTFIGPDNGIFSFLYPADEVLEVIWRPQSKVAPTFHGRDVFAPLLVKTVLSRDLHGLCWPKADPVRLDTGSSMVVHIDRFGNIITNIDCKHLENGCVLHIGDRDIDSIVRTYAEIPEGKLGLICGSSFTVEIAANQRNVALELGAFVGMPVNLV